MSNNSRWYVVHTYSGYENKVAGNIEKVVENRGMQDLILEVKIPTETVVEVKEDKTREVERKRHLSGNLLKNDVVRCYFQHFGALFCSA